MLMSVPGQVTQVGKGKLAGVLLSCSGKHRLTECVCYVAYSEQCSRHDSAQSAFARVYVSNTVVNLSRT